MAFGCFPVTELVQFAKTAIVEKVLYIISFSGTKLMTGVCQSRPEILEDGRIRLHKTWQWTSGDGSKGSSIVEEVK